MATELTMEVMTSQYMDVLKELGNIGAGNAMTALSTMLNCKVDMKVPQVRMLGFHEVGELIGGEEQVMAGIYLGVEGDITGSIMFLLEKESAKHIINKLMGMELASDNFGELEISALMEVGNIIAGSYLNSLAMITNLTILPSPPSISVDMAGAILSVPAIEFGIMGDNILLIQSQFMDEMNIDGYFIMVPDMDSYEKILRSLGVLTD